MAATKEQKNLFNFLYDYLRDNEPENGCYDSYREQMFQTEAGKDGWLDTTAGTISYEYVDSYGGEGQGEEYWSVYKFTRNGVTVHIKFNGSYASYSGSYYDDMYMVEPREVTLTKFFNVV